MMMPTDKYVEVVYQSEPIGPERIVLYLTSFDLKRYEQDQELEKRRFANSFELNTCIAPIHNGLYDSYYIKYFEDYCNALIKRYYAPYVNEAISLIDIYKDKLATPIETINTKKINDVVNNSNVKCDVVYGDVINCKEVHCKEIQGDVINCKVYKESD